MLMWGHITLRDSGSLFAVELRVAYDATLMLLVSIVTFVGVVVVNNWLSPYAAKCVASSRRLENV